MNLLPYTGRARVLADDINTDYIISSSRKKESIDPHVLSQYLLEDWDPAFAASVRPGDLIVAGKNFGCGSAMEVAVTVVLGAGIRAVVAKSFSRTYLRNAMNNGLLPVGADTSGIEEGDQVSLKLIDQQLWIEVQPAPESGAGCAPSRIVPCEPLPAFMLEMLNAGGLIPYLRKHRCFA